jgi:hypothetical protein
MGFKMNGFSGFGNDGKNNEKKGNKGLYENLNINDEGKPPGPAKPPSKVDADPHGVYDNSPHNVATRETEGTVEEQAENLKNAIKSGHTRLVNPSATPKKGLWANIHAKRKRIKEGSGEKMRNPGDKGAPSAQDLKDSQTKE